MTARREERRAERILAGARAMLATGYSPAEVAAELERGLELEQARQLERAPLLERLTAERFGRVSRAERIAGPMVTR
jgi:hypothetical protein